MNSEGVLLVSRFDEDLISLLYILNDIDGGIYWYRSRGEAVPTLRNRPIRLIVCDRYLPDGGWEDLLRAAETLEFPPPLIVTARFADEYLWAEVLNLGGYDVLAKPFDAAEVQRVTALAWNSRRRAASAA